MSTAAPTRSSLVRRLVLMVAGAGLIGLAVVPVSSSPSPPAAPCRPAARAAVVPPAAATSHGVDLELRVLHLRVEFPWLKHLPIAPARRIVITLMEPRAARE